jgi:hypothetical protein
MKLRLACLCFALALASRTSTAALLRGGPPMDNSYSGRGRGAGRVMSSGEGRPTTFDQSWWEPPPTIGPDPFLRGYSAKVYPRYGHGYGGMPFGGYGTAHHFWGGPSYHYPGQGAWWQGHSGSGASHPRFYGAGGQPMYHPRDSMGLGNGGTFALASPYYFTPPPMQGDWYLPKNPPPPPGGGGDE